MSATAGVTPDVVFEMLFAYQQSAALKAAIDLDLFTSIAEGAHDAGAIAQRAGASPRGIRILCDFLTTYKLLTKTGDQYALSPVAAIFLSRTSPACMGSTAQFLTLPELKENFDDLTGAVKRGGVRPAGNNVREENPIWVDFARAMVPMAMANAQALAGVIQLPASGTVRILDIAAGHGMYGIVLAQTQPNVHVTALDWAPVLAVAAEHAERAGVASRYETLAGDAFTTPLGEGYDLVLVTNFLHHFNADRNIAFLRTIAGALRPGGQIAIVEFVPNPDRVSPPMPARFALTMLAGTPEGDAYTLADLTRMLDAAGFGGVAAHSLPTPEALISATRR
jgi:SAM-dependent methyltransferase